MRKWLWERRLTLALVGVGVPLLTFLSFWNAIQPEWPFWLLCYLVGFPAGIAVVYGRFRGAEFWSSLQTWHRALVRCLAVLALWSLVYLSNQNQPEVSLIATAATTALLLLWGLYALFGRTVDAIWLRLRRK